MNTKDILELIDSIDVLNAGRTAERLGELKDMIAELDKSEQPHVHTVYDAVGGGYVCSGCDQRFVKPEHPAAGLTVEEVLGLVLDTEIGYNSTVGDLMNVVMIQKIRARLTAAMNAKTTKP